MLSLMINFRIILIIDVIATLNNLDYKQIINEFCLKKFKMNNISIIMNANFFVSSGHQRSISTLAWRIIMS